MNYTILLPEIVLTSTAMVVIVLDLYLGAGQKSALGYLSLLGVIGATAAVLPATGLKGEFWGNMISADAFTQFFKVIFLLVAGLVILSSMSYLEKRKIPAGEFYTLLVSATIGMMFMGSSLDLITIYLGLELTSISSYVLAGLLRNDPRSNEAAIKYFLNGALASAILLFGLSILYGLTGTTHLADIAAVITTGGARGGVSLPLLGAAIAFVLGGFGFKIAAVPFHLWAPDAYEGAPTPVTAFFSAGPKAGAFAAILRIFLVGLIGAQPQWALVVAVLSAVSMTVGNLTALMQTNIKRMMAYSSIAHVGYMLIGLTVATAAGTWAVMYYLLAYAVMNLGAFAVIIALDAFGPGDRVRDYAGLGRKAPFLGWALVFFFVSMIGVPPTGGFMGKFLLFSAAVQAGYIWLALFLAVNSAISVGYYYNVVKNMFLVGPGHESAAPVKPALGLYVVVALALVGTLALGAYPDPFLKWASAAAVITKF